MVGKADSSFVWLIAGEPSGDFLGAKLMSALRLGCSRKIRIEGIGGDAMAAEGLRSLFPISDISVMGLVEILPRILLIRKRLRQTIRRIQEVKPDIVVTIDAPGFCYDVWKGLRGTGIPLVHYVAPSVWAWRPDRAKKFASELDHLMTLLPFEPQYFSKYGLPSTFVGHPVIEGDANTGDGAKFRKKYKIEPETHVICVLPGSRAGEVKRLEKVFCLAAKIFLCNYPQTVFVFPTVSYLKDTVNFLAAGWPCRTIVVDNLKEKFDAMDASNAALAASGTVSLELANAKVPHIIAYRLSGLTVAIFKLLHGANQRYANLINILLQREVIPEFIQRRCRADLIGASLLELVREPMMRERQLVDVAEAMNMLRVDGQTPSDSAASVIFSVLNVKPDFNKENNAEDSHG